MAHRLARPTLRPAADQAEALDDQALPGVEGDPPGRRWPPACGTGVARGADGWSGRRRGRRRGRWSGWWGRLRRPRRSRRRRRRWRRRRRRRWHRRRWRRWRWHRRRTRRRRRLGGAHRHQAHGGQVDHVARPVVLLRPRRTTSTGGRRPRATGSRGRASRGAPGSGPRPRSRPGWRRRDRACGRVLAPSTRIRSSARPTPIGVPVAVVDHAQPIAALPGETPLRAEQHREEQVHQQRPPPTTTATPGHGPVVAEEPPPGGDAGDGVQRPGDRAVEGERVEAAVQLRDGRGVGWRSSAAGAHGFVTWMVTPSPRSITEPGSSCTAIPGCRSSGDEAGQGQHGAVGRAHVRDHRAAVVGTGAGPHLEVGRGDLLVGTGHGDQARLLGRGEPASLRARGRRARPGRRRRSRRWRRRAGRPARTVTLGAGGWPGMPGCWRANWFGSQPPATVWPSWSMSVGSNSGRAGKQRNRRPPAMGAAAARAGSRCPSRAAGPRAGRTERARRRSRSARSQDHPRSRARRLRAGPRPARRPARPRPERVSRRARAPRSRPRPAQARRQGRRAAAGRCGRRAPGRRRSRSPHRSRARRPRSCAETTPDRLRSTQVAASPPSTSTVSPSASSKIARGSPRSSTRVGSSPLLISTKPGSPRRPLAIRASSSSSKPAPPSASSQSAATLAFSLAGSSTRAVLAEDAEPARPCGTTARRSRSVSHGNAPSFSSRLTGAGRVSCGCPVSVNPTTSTTTAVALSCPPAATAAATIRSAASRGSRPRPRIRRDLGVVDHSADAVGAEHHPGRRPERQHEEVGLAQHRAAERAGDHVPVGVDGRRLGLDLTGVEQLLDHRVVDADLLERVLVDAVDPRVAEVDQQPLRALVVLAEQRRDDGGAGVPVGLARRRGARRRTPGSGAGTRPGTSLTTSGPRVVS